MGSLGPGIDPNFNTSCMMGGGPQEEVVDEVEEMEEHQPPQTMAEQLPNGGVRLLYADAATQKPFKTSRGFTLSVTSEDGVHFKLEDGAKMWLEAVAGSGAYISLLLAKLCLARWKLEVAKLSAAPSAPPPSRYLFRSSLGGTQQMVHRWQLRRCAPMPTNPACRSTA